MKKILALAVAVAMLASMAVTATAAPHESDAAIKFVLEGLDNMPDEGPFCPVEHPMFGSPSPFGSWNINFGSHEIPPIDDTNPITFVAYNAVHTAGANPAVAANLLPRAERVLGIGVQAWIADVNPVLMLSPRTWMLTAELGQFEITGGALALQGFDLYLTLNTAAGVEAIPEGADNVSIPVGLPNAGQTLTVYDVTLDQDGSGAGAQTVAEFGRNGIFGWEWFAVLEGMHDDLIPNNVARLGQASTDIIWDYFPDID